MQTRLSDQAISDLINKRFKDISGLSSMIATVPPVIDEFTPLEEMNNHWKFPCYCALWFFYGEEFDITMQNWNIDKRSKDTNQMIKSYWSYAKEALAALSGITEAHLLPNKNARTFHFNAILDKPKYRKPDRRLESTIRLFKPI